MMQCGQLHLRPVLLNVDVKDGCAFGECAMYVCPLVGMGDYSDESGNVMFERHERDVYIDVLRDRKGRDRYNHARHEFEAVLGAEEKFARPVVVGPHMEHGVRVSWWGVW